ncbi:MAG: UDP-N-acetylglucosamine 1-carboxyvinyltransferase, partial [Pseudomonadota bacterium]
ITVKGCLAVELNAAHIHSCVAPYDLVNKMRASILVLGPLLTRFGQAEIALPGGCRIGARPIDQHIEGLVAMGAIIDMDAHVLYARAPNGLQGTDFRFGIKTVTGTENLIMAACLARGTTRLRNVAMEPEIVDLANFLNTLGARVKGAGTDTIEIEGVPELKAGAYDVLPDRLETGTFLVAAAMTGGEVITRNTKPETLETVLYALSEAGATIHRGPDWISLAMTTRPKALRLITGPYPGFPTDMQAQMMALNAVAAGEGQITETIFENRFHHVHELQRMGAKLQIQGNSVLSLGGPLTGAVVKATDLRASAGLVLAALAAQGTTTIEDIGHIDRGYECIEEKFAQLGAKIHRISE